MNARTVSTAHGLVSRAALESLQEVYDTSALLSAVDDVDALWHELRSEGGIRDQLLQLRAMANAVINDGSPATPALQSLPEAACDLMEQIRDIRTAMAALELIVAPLAALAVSDDVDKSQTE